MIRKRTNKDMQEKTKCHTIQNDKWERKQYIKKYESNTIKISWKSDYIITVKKKENNKGDQKTRKQ